MLLLIVWIVVAVLAVGALAVLGYGLFGAMRRLDREMRALEGELQPVLQQVQGSLDAAAAQRAAARQARDSQVANG